MEDKKLADWVKENLKGSYSVEQIENHLWVWSENLIIPEKLPEKYNVINKKKTDLDGYEFLTHIRI